MVTVGRLGAIGLLFLTLAVSAQTPQPSFTLQSGGVVAATLPLAILEDARSAGALAGHADLEEALDLLMGAYQSHYL